MYLLLPLLLLLLISYLLGRLFKKSVVLYASFALGTTCFLLVSFLASLGNIDSSGQNLSESGLDAINGLFAGLIAFITVQAGGRIGIHFKTRKQESK